MMKKTKPNIIDVVIVTVLLLIAAAAILRTQHFNNAFDDTNSGDIIYTLCIYSESPVYCKALSEGDSIYLDAQKLFCGKVENVVCKYTDEQVIYPDGTSEVHLNPSLVDITVKIRVPGDLSENGFFIGERTYISLGQFYDMYSMNFSFNCQVISAFLEKAA